jgi:MerR family mercuric resistance operon transcriptional regulator
MTIGQLANAAGVRISTLRFYERRGLLQPSARSAAGYRQFSGADVARVRFLRRAQQLGFSLAELADMLALSLQRTMRRRDVAVIGASKLAELDQRIADLHRVRRAIAGLLAQPCIDPDAACPIIASLAEPGAPHVEAAGVMAPDQPARARPGAIRRRPGGSRAPAQPRGPGRPA